MSTPLRQLASLLFSAMFAGAISLMAASVQAQAFPAKPVRLIVPYAPGGSADIAARLVAEDWGKALGQSIFIENKAGASGNIGVDRGTHGHP